MVSIVPPEKPPSPVWKASTLDTGDPNSFTAKNVPRSDGKESYPHIGIILIPFWAAFSWYLSINCLTQKVSPVIST